MKLEGDEQGRGDGVHEAQVGMSLSSGALRTGPWDGLAVRTEAPPPFHSLLLHPLSEVLRTTFSIFFWESRLEPNKPFSTNIY